MSGCSFHVTCFIINGDLRADVVSFGAHIVSFGMPVASTLASLTIERSRGTWEHKKGNIGVQASTSVDLGWISGPHFETVFTFGALETRLKLYDFDA